MLCCPSVKMAAVQFETEDATLYVAKAHLHHIDMCICTFTACLRPHCVFELCIGDPIVKI